MSESSTCPPGKVERWLPVPDWEGWYEVSDRGSVRSLNRIQMTRCGLRRYSGKVLKPCLRRDGYLCVTLARPGEQRQYTIHSLILTAFTEPRPEGQEGRHGPGGKHDNSLGNLCWGTKSENAMDRLRDGTDPRGERHGQTKLTQALVDEIRTRYAAGEQQKSIANALRVSPDNVWTVVHRKSWKYS